ncbi:heterokaryon incompatibility protein-domain-containing protein [Bombardia bombarda]|uniref:Heterokaryon incompatibility protein-domain-containing protein n=1 Tax=Bombardia bombarda TaxID=252184 RepID=A0AA40C4R2_9PEZI|nr:heterokaryon incompatibility protein-domain-containing protein [Bombardia bombarda]
MATSNGNYSYSPGDTDWASCQFCPRMDWASGPAIDPSHRRPSREEQSQIFHHPCPCDSDDMYMAERNPLCPSCRHLRLRHLLFCPRLQLTEIKVELPSIDEMRSSNCTLCHLFSDAVILQARLLGMSNIDIPDLWMHLSIVYTTQSQDTNAIDISESRCMRISLNFVDEKPRSWNPALSHNLAEFDVRISDLSTWSNFELHGGKYALTHPQAVRPSTVDWDLIQGWIRQCRKNHDKPVNSPRPRLLPLGFKIIDVALRQVVELADVRDFVALSYVWGRQPDKDKLLATKETITGLSTVGGIRDDKLPATIIDALTVCSELGYQYLWVDRLCIVQDDLDHKMLQISAMDEVYASASLVIVQACGEDMESPLIGVNAARPADQQQLDILGLRLTNVLPKTTNFSYKSAWSSRGWTYQESVLAKRKLIFTDFEVLLDCDAAVLWEDRYGRNTLDKKTEYHFGDTMLHDGALIDDFFRHLENYTSRNLSFQSDIYNAFEGILASVDSDGSGHIHCLPRSNFDQALLFRSVDYRTPGPKKGLRQVAGMVLPTWSWSSLIGTVGAPQGAFMGSLVLWHEVYESGVLTPIKADVTPWHWENDWGGPDQKIHPPQFYLALAWQNVEILSGSVVDGKFTDVEREMVETWPTYQAYWREMVSSQVLRQNSIKLPHSHKNGMIACTAQTGQFKIQEARKGVHRILGPNGSGIGLVRMDEPRALELLSKPAWTERTHLFVGISVSVDTDGEVLDVDKRYQERYDELYEKGETDPNPYSVVSADEEFGILFRDGEGDTLKSYSPPVVNVILVGAREDGCYCRVAMGWVLLTKWLGVEREEKTVFLV